MKIVASKYSAVTPPFVLVQSPRKFCGVANFGGFWHGWRVKITPFFSRSIYGLGLSASLFLAGPAAHAASSPAGPSPLVAPLPTPEELANANSAVVPVPTLRPEMHAAFVEQAKKGDIDVLFLGDSITDWWRSNGKEVFDQYYGNWKIANFGIAAEKTQQVLWRLQNGEGTGFQPKLVMLMIGTNNTPGNSDDQIAAGVGAVVGELRKDFPAAKILLLGIFPKGGPADPVRARLGNINRSLAKLEDRAHVFYLDIGAKFLDAQGAFLPGAFKPDQLHPDVKGYEIWAEAVKEPLANLLKATTSATLTAAANTTTATTAAAPATKPNTAIIPVPQRAEDKLPPNAINGFNTRHQTYVARAKQGQIDVLFLGDSITQGWPGPGKTVWAQYYGAMKAEQFGIGYDRTQHVLWRLQNGEGEGFSPKVVELLIGTNNLGPNTPAETAAGITAVVGELRKRFPDAKILLLGIFPRGNPGETAWKQVIEVNQVIAKLDDQKHVFYLDIGPKFLAADGSIAPGMMGDQAKLHPSAQGYGVWAEATKDLLGKLLQNQSR